MCKCLAPGPVHSKHHVSINKCDYYDHHIHEVGITHLSSEGLPWWLRWQRACLQCKRPGFDTWVGKITWRREWLPTPVFWPGEFHGQRSLEVYTIHGVKESQTGLSD